MKKGILKKDFLNKASKYLDTIRKEDFLKELAEELKIHTLKHEWLYADRRDLAKHPLTVKGRIIAEHDNRKFRWTTNKKSTTSGQCLSPTLEEVYKLKRAS
jgi:hypothetical protein